MVIDVRYTGETNDGFTNGKVYEQALLVNNDSLIVVNDHRNAIDFSVPGEWKSLFENLGVHGSARRKEGLYNKYQIINRETGQEADGQYFVLKPLKDPAARAALMAYAEATNNQQLATDITVWLSSLPELAKCDWCDNEVAGEQELSHPHMLDMAFGKRMCRHCWDHDREVYKGSYGEDIGEFKPIQREA